MPNAPDYSGYRPHSIKRSEHYCRSPWSLSTQITDPLHNGLFAATNAWAADATVLFERTFGSHWPDTNFAAILLEEQPIARSNAESAANVARHRDLPLARDPCLFLHRATSSYSLL